MKKLIAISFLAFLLVSCAPVPSADPAVTFMAAWDAADAKRQEAAAVGYEWRDTKKMLKKAKAEFEAGNTEMAMKLVTQAREEAEDGIAQEMRESTAWTSRVIQ